jgi:hypothetical protein
MKEIFYGDWTVEVFSKDAAFSQQFIIDGSDGSDGTYPAAPGTPLVSVSGPRWFITMEWNNDAGSGWQPSDVRRTSTTFTLEDGLVVFLGADDNFAELRDHDFNDVVLRCHNTDPTISHGDPITQPLDFTFPRPD